MGVLVIDAAMDAALDYLADNITEMYVCAGDPTTRAAAITAALAEKLSLSSADFTGPANGDVSGRKITKDAETALTIDADGTAATICFCSATTLLWKVDLASTQALTSGGTVDTGAVDNEIADAV